MHTLRKLPTSRPRMAKRTIRVISTGVYCGRIMCLKSIVRWYCCRAQLVLTLWAPFSRRCESSLFCHCEAGEASRSNLIACLRGGFRSRPNSSPLMGESQGEGENEGISCCLCFPRACQRIQRATEPASVRPATSGKDRSLHRPYSRYRWG
jgi:hypothetical protein